MTGGTARLTSQALALIADALLELDEVASAPSRHQLISLMDNRISTVIPALDAARPHVVAWLRTCSEFSTGRENLVAALRSGLPDDPARARVLELIDRLWPAQ